MHGKDAAGDELPVLPDAEVPRLYPHHVIKHELQVQPPLHTHLETRLSQLCPLPIPGSIPVLPFAHNSLLHILLQPAPESGCVIDMDYLLTYLSHP